MKLGSLFKGVLIFNVEYQQVSRRVEIPMEWPVQPLRDQAMRAVRSWQCERWCRVVSDPWLGMVEVGKAEVTILGMCIFNNIS